MCSNQANDTGGKKGSEALRSSHELVVLAIAAFWTLLCSVHVLATKMENHANHEDGGHKEFVNHVNGNGPPSKEHD